MAKRNGFADVLRKQSGAWNKARKAADAGGSERAGGGQKTRSRKPGTGKLVVRKLGANPPHLGAG